MHRSGTSALGGALTALGLTVGKTAMPADPDGRNPRGFYENLALMRFNDRFLESIGSEWRDCEPLRNKKFRGISAWRFRGRLLRLLVDEFGTERALIKDPRMCRLLPLWLPLMAKRFPQARFILPIRHPVEVAASLKERDQLSLDHGLKLWAGHVLESERATRGLDRRFTTYDQLIQFPIETVRVLAEELGLKSGDIAGAVSQQIDSGLRHHASLPWPTGEPLEDLTLSIYSELGKSREPDVEKLDRIRNEYYHRVGWRG